MREHSPAGVRAAYGFLKIRTKVLRGAVADMLHAPPPGLPLPPALPRFRVHGAADRHSFMQVGESCATDLERPFSPSAGISIPSPTFWISAADAGECCVSCISHRYCVDFTVLILMLKRLSGASTIFHLPRSKRLSPFRPCPFGPEQFDLIFAISVFTHLDEKYQFASLNELKRYLSPAP